MKLISVVTPCYNEEANVDVIYLKVKEIFQKLDLQENGDLVDLEFILRCKQLGVQILEVPIVSAVRHGGESTTNLISAFKMYWGAFQMRHRVNSNERTDEGM